MRLSGLPIMEKLVGRAYQVVIDGDGSTVASSLSLAIAHIAHRLARLRNDGNSDLAVRSALDEHGFGGTLYHRLRWELASAPWSKVVIYEHDTHAAPGRGTAVAYLDLKTDPDPSYALQAALYRAHDDPGAIDSIADTLYEEVCSDISYQRPGEDAGAAINRLRGLQADTGGIPLIPSSGRPTSIRRDLPDAVVNEYFRITRTIYAEETSACYAH
jgi:hypothetical protein